MLNVTFRGRVIDMWTGTDAKYPNTSVTFKLADKGGQLKVRFTPDEMKKSGIRDDGLYDVAGSVFCANSKIGQMLTFASGSIKEVK